MDKQIAEILVYLNAMWRRRWLALTVAAVTCLAGWSAVALLPDNYTSSARVYVDTDSVLRPLLKDIAVEDNFQAEVQIMQQTLLSRPNLAQVARATDLDLTVAGPSEMEGLLDSLADRTSIVSNCPRSAGGGARTSICNLFTISFDDTDPRRAKAAVQALLNIFMEGQLGKSRTDMDSAQQFIDEQIRGYQNQLEIAEKRLADFKQENVLLTPESGSYQRRLERLNEEYAAVAAALDDARAERDVLQEQLQNIPQVIGNASQGFGAGPPSDFAIRIVQLQSQLDGLLTTYTGKHPDVVALQRRIADLKAQEERETKAMLEMTAMLEEDAEVSGESADPAAQEPVYGTPNPAFSELRLIIAEKEAEIARFEEQAARARANLSELQSMALEVPLIEAELLKLTRDYDVIKNQYEALLSRRESAKIAREREASGDKVQFRVVEPPEAPVRPTGPQRQLLLSAVLPLGFGAGAALTFVLAILSRTFVDPRRLGEDLGLPVLGSVSAVSHAGDQRWQWIDTGIFLIAVMAMLGIYALLMLVETTVGLGRIVGPATEVNSIGELVTLVKTAVSRSLEMLGQ